MLSTEDSKDKAEVKDQLTQESSYMNKMKERMKEIDSKITTVVTIPQYSKHFRTQLAKMPREYYRETKHHYMSLYEHLTKLYDVDPYVYRQREEGYSPFTSHVFPYSKDCAQCNHTCSVKVDPYDPYHTNPMVLSDKCNRNHLHRWVEFVDLNPFFLLRKDIHEVWSVNNHCYVPEVKREVVMHRDDANRLIFLMQQDDFDFELFLIESQRRFDDNYKLQQQAAHAQANLLRNSQPNSYSIRIEGPTDAAAATHARQKSQVHSQPTDRSNDKYDEINLKLLSSEEENKRLREQIQSLQAKTNQSISSSQSTQQRKKVQIVEDKSYYRRYKAPSSQQGDEESFSTHKSAQQGHGDENSLIHIDDRFSVEDQIISPTGLLPIKNRKETLLPPSKLDIDKKYNDQYKIKPSQRDMPDLRTIPPYDPQYTGKPALQLSNQALPSSQQQSQHLQVQNPSQKSMQNISATQGVGKKYLPSSEFQLLSRNELSSGNGDYHGHNANLTEQNISDQERRRLREAHNNVISSMVQFEDQENVLSDISFNKNQDGQQQLLTQSSRIINPETITKPQSMLKM